MFMTSICRSTGPTRISKWTLICSLLVSGMFAGIPSGLFVFSSSSLLAQEAPEAAQQDAPEVAKVFAQRCAIADHE